MNSTRLGFTTVPGMCHPLRSRNNSRALDVLIAATRRVVAAERSARRVSRILAEVLAPFLQLDDLLTPEQHEPDATNYRQHVLHVEPDGSFSIAALIWLPGQATPIHDHVSWCVVGVYKGTERETRYQMRGSGHDAYLVVTGTNLNERGTVDALVPPGDIHSVANASDAVAVSLHVYGVDLCTLGCSIRRNYQLPVRVT